VEYWLRNKSDEEIKFWNEKLSHTPNARTPRCATCNVKVGYADRKTINVSIYDRHKGQKSKKLCTLCNMCYSNLIRFLDISDVKWGD
jgi:uncharacterized protein with PIN domain